MSLSDAYIRTLKYPGKPKKYFDGGGLYLFFSASGNKLWRMAYRFGQKPKNLSFGEYPLVTLKDARDRRDEAKKLLANGIDPGAQKKAVKETLLSETNDTFKNIALEWHETRTADFTEKHRARSCTAWRNISSRLSATVILPEWKPRTFWQLFAPWNRKAKTKPPAACCK